jgi:hypothetical protein
MVELMNAEKPNHIHLLGGEVRYKSESSEFNDGKFVNPNLVYMTKSNPGTQSYTGSSPLTYSSPLTATIGIYAPIKSMTFFGEINVVGPTINTAAGPLTSPPIASISDSYQTSATATGFTTGGAGSYSGSISPTTGWNQGNTTVNVSYPVGYFTPLGTGLKNIITVICNLRNTYDFIVQTTRITVLCNFS